MSKQEVIAEKKEKSVKKNIVNLKTKKEIDPEVIKQKNEMSEIVDELVVGVRRTKPIRILVLGEDYEGQFFMKISNMSPSTANYLLDMAKPRLLAEQQPL